MTKSTEGDVEVVRDSLTKGRKQCNVIQNRSSHRQDCCSLLRDNITTPETPPDQVLLYTQWSKYLMMTPRGLQNSGASVFPFTKL